MAGTTVRELLAGLPVGAGFDPGYANDVRFTVVLDDDPTGSQCVRDLPVITRFRDEDVRWALAQPQRSCFFLTNTRSMRPDDAAALTAMVVMRVFDVAGELGVGVRFVSRGDSTLRGHFPLETGVVQTTLDAREGPVETVTVVAPAFPGAGRVTLGAVHWVIEGDIAVPVGETDYARDASFGFRSSDLRAWVREQSAPDPVSVESVPLAAVRGGTSVLAARLLHAEHGGVLVVDAVEESDLDRLAAAIRLAEEHGRRIVTRAGPSLARALCGVPLPPALTESELADCVDRPGPGLLVVGSHVGLTTRQLSRLPDLAVVEIDVDDVLQGRADVRPFIDAVVAELSRRDVLVVTSRTVRAGASAADSLGIAGRVAETVVRVTRGVLDRQRPAWLLGKGGITSSDLVTKSAGLHRGRIAGQLLPGLVSLWQPVEQDHRSVPCVIFPGNVGGDGALLEVVNRLRGASTMNGARGGGRGGAHASEQVVEL